MIKEIKGLTEHQNKIFSSMIKDKSNEVFFSGAAGTGKSFGITKFLESLPEYMSVRLTSTTHQSISVLREMITKDVKCNVEISTIHSYLGFTIVYENGNEVLKKLRKDHDPECCNYLFVDECSYLTRDLLKEIQRIFGSSVSKKTILIGDECQLSIDPFLNLSSIPKYELTENMRQDKDSSLFRYCDNLRTEIKTIGKPQEIPVTPDIALYQDHKDFIESYKCSFTTDKVILAYLNNTVKTYNNNIKKHMLGKDTYSIGDNIIVLAPVHKNTPAGKKIVINNRERVTIESVIDKSDYYEMGIETKDKKYYEINVPKTKVWYNNALNILKNSALSDKSKWKNYYDFKENYNFVHHCYALTVFSAQGGTFEEVFIDLSDFNPPNDPMFINLMKMVYVAMTRAKCRVHIFMGNSRDYTSFKG